MQNLKLQGLIVVETILQFVHYEVVLVPWLGRLPDHKLIRYHGNHAYNKKIPNGRFNFKIAEFSSHHKHKQKAKYQETEKEKETIISKAQNNDY